MVLFVRKWQNRLHTQLDTPRYFPPIIASHKSMHKNYCFYLSVCPIPLQRKTQVPRGLEHSFLPGLWVESARKQEKRVWSHHLASWWHKGPDRMADLTINSTSVDGGSARHQPMWWKPHQALWWNPDTISVWISVHIPNNGRESYIFLKVSLPKVWWIFVSLLWLFSFAVAGQKLLQCCVSTGAWLCFNKTLFTKINASMEFYYYL